jgi:hypothetical protein
MTRQGDSAEQREAQALISKEIEAVVGRELEERTVNLSSGAPVRGNIKVYVVELEGNIRDGIRSAQVRQEMVNPAGPASA